MHRNHESSGRMPCAPTPPAPHRGCFVFAGSHARTSLCEQKQIVLELMKLCNHIRYGYEALDSNMQVIQRARPYNAEKDAQYAPQRAAAAKQRESDLKLKRAYTNSQVATQKTQYRPFLYLKAD